MKQFSLLAILVFCSIWAHAQHTLVLKNGDKINGVIIELVDDVVTISVNRQLKKYPLMQVSSMFFNEYVAYDGKLDASTPERTVKSGDFTVKYVIKDREMITPPRVSLGKDEHGTVVVDIIVNTNGNVISAKPGAVGSTTTSEYLYTKAQFAAQGAKFNPDTKGPVETHGTITIIY